MRAVARQVTHRYVDPLTEVWLGAARRIGLRVVRTPDAYAATDGGGTLAIGTEATLDADDSLAQMIFHELCHSLVEGEESFTRPDWGLDNTLEPDWHEYACQRLQWMFVSIWRAPTCCRSAPRTARWSPITQRARLRMVSESRTNRRRCCRDWASR